MPSHEPLPDVAATGPDEQDLVRDHLRSLSEEALVGLLTDRPELLRGAAPADLDDLAQRLAAPGYVAEAVDRLDAPTSVVLEALSFLGRGARLGRLVALLAPDGPVDDPAGAVRARVEDLLRVGLVVPAPTPAHPDGLRTTPGAQRVLVPLLGGIPLDDLLERTDAPDLARRLRAWGLPTDPAGAVHRVRNVLNDPDLVRRLTARADARTGAALRELAEAVLRPHEQFRPDRRATADAVAWALEHGLAWDLSQGARVLPREVALALLEGSVRVPLPVRGPDLPTVPVAPETAHRAAAGAAVETLTAVSAVVELLARAPVPTRKDGSIGAREIGRTAKTLATDARLVRFALTAANQLGLLARAGETSITASHRAPQWRRRPPAERYADLLRTWWDWPTLVVRDRDLDDRPAAIGGGTTAPRAAEIRRELLRHLGRLPAGRGVTSAGDLSAHLAWARPRALEPHDADDVADVLAEAELVGAVAVGTLSGAGHALVGDDRDALVRDADLLLPAVNARASFGSDLTVLVAGDPAAHVVDVLDTVAEREARGAANSWRFTDATFRAALDAGHTVEDLLDGLRELSDKPLPQTLEYLARDVGRRYGKVGIRPAGTVLVGEEALLAELRTHSGLRRFALVALAPTVLASAAAPADVLAGVRAAGYLPREENLAGEPVGHAVTRARPHLDEPAAPGGPDASPDVAGAQDVDRDPVAHALRLRAGAPPAPDPAVEKLARSLRKRAELLPEGDVRQLAHAVVHRSPVHLTVLFGGFYEDAVVLSEPTVRAGALYDGGHPVVADVAMVVTVTPLE
ncbi:helicase-associated domain-containing protein [Kineococcus sp. TBRC 1896]|uniref:Helicase-associated domain-containing protein n=1 Tax=Kineococcus mangrovi TaxID=1660183 RepID=A0ABV4I1J2_9ACTN